MAFRVSKKGAGPFGRPAGKFWSLVRALHADLSAIALYCSEPVSRWARPLHQGLSS
jgi:hypothetical protein